MAATDGQIVVAAARWSDDACYLREFVGKQRLPAVIKITKGQYGGLGVPTLPAPGLQSTALLVSAGRRRKILAQAVKIKEGRRVVGVGPRLAIPDSYPGYFEILSEEGRAARGIESVAELARRCPESGALLRESARALGCRQDEETGALVPESSRSIPAGETITIMGEVTLPGRGKFLRCQDAKGDGILLHMDQRSRFSALAREDSIGGVHTARALLTKRLPLTVRLVHGQPPRGLKSTSQFLPELRLLSSFEEEHVFALPLQRDGAAAALPLAAPLKLTRARNEDALRAMPEFARLVERAGRLVAEVVDRAHVLEGRLGEGKPTRASRAAAGFLRRSSGASESMSSQHVRVHAHHHHHGVTALITRDENRAPPNLNVLSVQSGTNCVSGTGFTEDYDEIDQIYDYVRGFAPLPRSSRCYEAVVVPAPLDDRPEPPPIETIPTKKNQAEKRSRRAGKETLSQSLNGHHHQQLQQAAAILPIPVLLPSRPEKPPLAKLYVKNSGGTQRSRALTRQKSASPLKETPPAFKGGSPLFNIRYKSLTNLQQAMELDGTLDSSHSGGRTSGDSGAGAKLPEKRSRRLSRPRSLTNLVWELRGGSAINCTRPETPPTVAPLPPTKCGQRLAVTVVTPRRVGTLYL